MDSLYKVYGKLVADDKIEEYINLISTRILEILEENNIPVWKPCLGIVINEDASLITNAISKNISDRIFVYVIYLQRKLSCMEVDNGETKY